MNRRLLSSIAIFISALLVAGILWTNRFNISDWIVLRGYTPSADIAKIADDAAMTDYGKRLFYVNNPQLSDRESFNSQCTSTEVTIVLGCYTGRNIYIFDVQDPNLLGIKQVTAAHEMLHAAYDRLSPDERKRIDTLTAVAFQRINDPRLNDLAKSYAEKDQSVVPNELHSILGTEARNLGPELEEYYKKYFKDRDQIITFSENYQKVFDDLKKQVQQYDAELTLRKAEVIRIEEDLSRRGQELVTRKAELDKLAASGQTGAYNARVPAYNAAVNSYNAEIGQARTLITEYNALVEKRNAITVQQQSLADSIDSRLKTIE